MQHIEIRRADPRFINDILNTCVNIVELGIFDGMDPNGSGFLSVETSDSVIPLIRKLEKLVIASILEQILYVHC